MDGLFKGVYKGKIDIWYTTYGTLYLHTIYGTLYVTVTLHPAPRTGNA